MKSKLMLLASMLLIATPAFAIDSEPILKSSVVAIDSEPILKFNSVAIDSEPILKQDSVAIDSEPILKGELEGMSVVYKKEGTRYIKVTYKPVKAEELSEKEGKEMEKKGLVHEVKRDSKNE